MCMLCDQVSGQSFGVAESHDRFAFYGLSIAPAELLDNGMVGVTRRATATDGVLDYYLHTPGGAVTVSGGGLGEQEIQSLSIPGSDQSFFNAMVRRLDRIIDLDFRQVDKSSSANLDLYYDTEIDLGGRGVVLGLATYSGGDSWELFLNYPYLDDDEPYRRYALIHEFGHSLGLEHPFDSSDGDVFNGQTNPSLSAYPEDTVMAYRNPAGGSWPEFFSDNDINALIQAWGAERQFLSDGGTTFFGNSYKDDVWGGRDSDVIFGNAGFDSIHGKAGDDELRGGLNADWIKGGGGSDHIYGGRGHDTINGGWGDDFLRGGLGRDMFVISEGSDFIEDFNLMENDCIGMLFESDFSFAQDGANLQLLTSGGVTTLLGIDQSIFEDETRIEWII